MIPVALGGSAKPGDSAAPSDPAAPGSPLHDGKSRPRQPAVEKRYSSDFTGDGPALAGAVLTEEELRACYRLIALDYV